LARRDALRVHGGGPMNAQRPKGQLPRGQLPRGQLPRGQLPRGQRPKGQHPRGQGPTPWSLVFGLWELAPWPLARWPLARWQLALWALVLCGACGACAAAPPLRVCADPNNLPFSNDRGEGFENKLAEMIAAETGARVEYTWWAQRRGFVRNTLRAGECDVLMGVPTEYELAETTRPYYR